MSQCGGPWVLFGGLVVRLRLHVFGLHVFGGSDASPSRRLVTGSEPQSLAHVDVLQVFCL